MCRFIHVDVAGLQQANVRRPETAQTRTRQRFYLYTRPLDAQTNHRASSTKKKNALQDGVGGEDVVVEVLADIVLADIVLDTLERPAAVDLGNTDGGKWAEMGLGD